MWNLVIVDDELLIAEGLAEMIRGLGVQYRICRVFDNALDAEEYLLNTANEVDLLISDIQMPDMSGLELIERVSVAQPAMMCAVLTGYSEFEYAKNAIRLGVVRYLVKPVEQMELQELLDALACREVSRLAVSPAKVNALSHETLYIKNAIDKDCRGFDMCTIANELQRSKEYLMRLFKRETGMNLTDYLTSIRMRTAQSLLQQPCGYKIYEVCEMVGYSDYMYFSKQFKKLVGMSPKVYQKYMYTP